jgi:hypothetical protein
VLAARLSDDGLLSEKEAIAWATHAERVGEELRLTGCTSEGVARLLLQPQPDMRLEDFKQRVSRQIAKTSSPIPITPWVDAPLTSDHGGHSEIASSATAVGIESLSIDSDDKAFSDIDRRLSDVTVTSGSREPSLSFLSDSEWTTHPAASQRPEWQQLICCTSESGHCGMQRTTRAIAIECGTTGYDRTFGSASMARSAPQARTWADEVDTHT